MASDIFINLGIKGESTDGKHKGEIDVLSWSWGVSQTGTSHGGGGSGAGKANVQDLSFTKPIDKSSPLLFQMCCTGAPIATATLTCRKAGGSPLEYIVITLTQAIITSVSPSGDRGSDVLTETVTLNFTSYTYTYTPQKPDGSGDAALTKGFNMGSNTST